MWPSGGAGTTPTRRASTPTTGPIGRAYLGAAPRGLLVVAGHPLPPRRRSDRRGRASAAGPHGGRRGVQSARRPRSPGARQDRRADAGVGRRRTGRFRRRAAYDTASTGRRDRVHAGDLHGGDDVLLDLADRQAFLEAAGPDATLRTWPDGDHTIYNHCRERTAFVADWLTDKLRRPRRQERMIPGSSCGRRPEPSERPGAEMTTGVLLTATTAPAGPSRPSRSSTTRRPSRPEAPVTP